MEIMEKKNTSSGTELFRLVGRIISSLPGMIPVDATIHLEVLKRKPPRNW